MVSVLSSYRCRGQPLFRVWSHNKTRVYWFTREIEGPAVGWRVKRYVTLGMAKLDRRQKHETTMAKIKQAEGEVLALPGIERAR